MAKNDLTIDVTAKLTVSDEVADRCLKLLEWWQNDHAEQRIMGTTNPDGSIRFYRELKHDPATGD